MLIPDMFKRQSLEDTETGSGPSPFAFGLSPFHLWPILFFGEKKLKNSEEHLLSIMLLIKFVCGDLSYFYKYMTSDLGAAQDNTSVLLSSSN